MRPALDGLPRPERPGARRRAEAGRLSGTDGVFRLIVDGVAPGAWNMAVDEALLDGCALESAPPALRLYGWCPAALSLGSRQPLPGAALPGSLGALGVDLVRRPTGGGAVLHERERTYAVIGRLRAGPFGGGVVATYRRIAAALVAAMQSMGVAAEAARETRAGRRPPGACFEDLSPCEIAVRGRKLVGSAQLRRRGAFLQHGSIPLRLDAERMERAWRSPLRRERFTDLETALGRTVEPDEIDRALVRAVAVALGVGLEPAELSPSERRRAERYVEQKYARSGWTLEGRASAA